MTRSFASFDLREGLASFPLGHLSRHQIMTTDFHSNCPALDLSLGDVGLCPFADTAPNPIKSVSRMMSCPESVKEMASTEVLVTFIFIFYLHKNGKNPAHHSKALKEDLTLSQEKKKQKQMVVRRITKLSNAFKNYLNL
jgi:hypothetical protein